ncbi:hypothetical protein [Lactiplantibacillus herbarum]|uniref:hypothetical protein n=1 Tax=Lactiplantibacillus herbarum TaxID=1670446 RepID=UPI00064E4764|nr:hypothetical protein [Lactiplantibacillus herbarum]
MKKITPVTVTDIADNLAHQPTFMSIKIGDQQYSTAPKPVSRMFKLLNEGAAMHGQLTITPGRLSFADEKGQEFQSLAPTSNVITGVQIVLYRSLMDQPGFGLQMDPRFTVALTLTTTTATYQLLNTNLTVIPALLAWTREFQLALSDPLHLMTSELDWSQLTAAQFEELTKDTPYFDWQQAIGVPIKAEK